VRNKAGRPRRPFDWNLVDSLCILQASIDYIAERILISEGKPVNAKSVDTATKLIQRRIKEKWGMNFVLYTEKKLEGRKIQLRQTQWELAIKKQNPTMAIWMGKNYLNQSDKVEQKSEVKQETTEVVYQAEWGSTAEVSKLKDES
jgi:hypothetical protein